MRPIRGCRREQDHRRTWATGGYQRGCKEGYSIEKAYKELARNDTRTEASSTTDKVRGASDALSMNDNNALSTTSYGRLEGEGLKDKGTPPPLSTGRFSL